MGIKRKIVISLITGTTLLAYKAYKSEVEKHQEERYSSGILPTDEDLLRSPKYKHVVIFGVDGAGASVTDCYTPRFDEIFKDGNINYNGIAEYPTQSAENWSSMFTGMSPQKHQDSNARAALMPKSSKYPTFFKIHSLSDPEASFVSIVNWTPVNKGLIENDIENMFKDSPEGIDSVVTDENVTALALEKLNEKVPTILFLQYDSVDDMGHAYGGGSKHYRQCIEILDKHLGEIYDFYKEKGLLDDTLFIYVTDHGHTLKGGHGGDTALEKETMIALSGKDVIKGSSGKYLSRDLASIVLYALGDKQPEHMEGRVPRNLFKNL